MTDFTANWAHVHVWRAQQGVIQLRMARREGAVLF